MHTRTQWKKHSHCDTHHQTIQKRSCISMSALYTTVSHAAHGTRGNTGVGVNDIRLSYMMSCMDASLSVMVRPHTAHAQRHQHGDVLHRTIPQEVSHECVSMSHESNTHSTWGKTSTVIHKIRLSRRDSQAPFQGPHAHRRQ